MTQSNVSLSSWKEDLVNKFSKIIKQYRDADSNMAAGVVLNDSCTFEQETLSEILLAAANKVGWELINADYYGLADFSDPKKSADSKLLFLLPKTDNEIDEEDLQTMMYSRSRARGIVVVANPEVFNNGACPYYSLNSWLENFSPKRYNAENEKKYISKYLLKCKIIADLGETPEPTDQSTKEMMLNKFLSKHPPLNDDFSADQFDMAEYKPFYDEWQSDLKENAPKLLWLGIARESDLKSNDKPSSGNLELIKEARDSNPSMVLEVDIPALRISNYDRWLIKPSPHSSI